MGISQSSLGGRSGANQTAMAPPNLGFPKILRIPSEPQAAHLETPRNHFELRGLNVPGILGGRGTQSQGSTTTRIKM